MWFPSPACMSGSTNYSFFSFILTYISKCLLCNSFGVVFGWCLWFKLESCFLMSYPNWSFCDRKNPFVDDENVDVCHVEEVSWFPLNSWEYCDRRWVRFKWYRQLIIYALTWTNLVELKSSNWANLLSCIQSISICPCVFFQTFLWLTFPLLTIALIKTFSSVHM